MTWVLILMMMSPEGNVLGLIEMAMPDHETCQVVGDQITRETVTMDTYHCVNLEALLSEQPSF
jgi:hypothetical protein